MIAPPESPTRPASPVATGAAQSAGAAYLPGATASGRHDRIGSRRCHLLREDPELAEAIPVPRRTLAIEGCVVTELSVPRARSTDPGAFETPGGIGVLVLDGLLVCRHVVAGKFGTELLGAGDLLGVQQPGAEMPAVATRYAVAEPVRGAVLDKAFTQRELSRFPELGVALCARAQRRSLSLAVSLAIISRPRIADRLYLLFCHLAERWGRVRVDHLLLPLRLTHSLLAELVAARRPTVSTALSDLDRRGLVRKSEEGWVLSRAHIGAVGDPGVLHTHNGIQLAHPGPDRRRPPAVP